MVLHYGDVVLYRFILESTYLFPDHLYSCGAYNGVRGILSIKVFLCLFRLLKSRSIPIREAFFPPLLLELHLPCVHG